MRQLQPLMRRLPRFARWIASLLIVLHCGVGTGSGVWAQVASPRTASEATPDSPAGIEPPLDYVIGESGKMLLSASIVVRNEPYDDGSGGGGARA